MTADKTTERLDALVDEFGTIVFDHRRDPDSPTREHLDAWMSALVSIFNNAEYAMRALERRTSAYGEQHVLRDDEGADPGARLTEAVDHLADARAALERSVGSLYQCGHAMYHLSVAGDPETTQE